MPVDVHLCLRMCMCLCACACAGAYANIRLCLRLLLARPPVEVRLLALEERVVDVELRREAPHVPRVVELVLVGACCEHEPADRGPRKGVTNVVVNVRDDDPHYPLEEREGVRRADDDGEERRAGNCDEVIDRVFVLRREDHVLPPLVVHLVVHVELREVRDPVRHVKEELVHKCQQNVAARRGCVAWPVVGREAHGGVEEKVLARRENRDEDAVVEEE